MMSPQYSLLSIVLAIAIIAGVSDALRPQKIVGGEFAKEGEFPYVAALLQNGRHRCGAAIVSERHVLTAANCIRHLSPPFNNTVVVTGSINAYSGERHEIMGIAYDDRYSASVRASPYDIAVIVLRNNITFNDNQTSVAWPNGPLPEGETATMAGWGHTPRWPSWTSNYLKKFNSTILSHNECVDLIDIRYNLQEDYHVCTSSPRGTGACTSDTGGPLVWGGQLIGINSYGFTCGAGLPDIYINVFNCRRWIRTVMSWTPSLLKTRRRLIIDGGKVVVKIIIDRSP